MAALVARAPAKLNLYLHVLGKRADGYHALESLVTFTALADMLEVSESVDVSLTLAGEFAAQAGNGESNLVLKAAQLLQTETGTRQGAALHLTKNIPVGAGLGGGSADAAAALRALNEFWLLGLGDDVLHRLVTKLGADVAMCLASKPAIARGVGEQLTPLAQPLPVFYAVLVYPRTPLLTAEVFRALDIASLPASREFAVPDQPSAWLPALARETRNDLQRPAIAVRAEVGEVLLALETVQPAADLVRMSGSGACCFALYMVEGDALKAAASLRQQYPQWWVSVTRIG